MRGLLPTLPGERMNRPPLGSGLRQLVLEPNRRRGLPLSSVESTGVALGFDGDCRAPRKTLQKYDYVP